MKDIKPIKSTSVTKQIAEQLKNAIIKGDLKRGDQLPTEMELAQSYGVSRPTIREAFKRLAAQNLIQSRRGPTGGTFVGGYGIEDASEMMISSTTLMLSLESVSIEDVIDVRLSMELQCCVLVMRNWTDDVGRTIDDALERLKAESLTDSEFCDADVNFHRVIVQASGNKMLEYLMYGVNESLVPIMNMVIVNVRDRSETIAYYTNLRDALFAKDQKSVERILTSLMKYIGERITEAQKQRELYLNQHQ